ncbi:MAG: hypothetical protein EWV84_00125 [Microcystis sp. M_QC_C_20170808_M3Col]|nr:MAG: hypothetical protein EWV84_00125 [Microcystis sp. M_QC_C_20170808_M3Col]
MVYSSYQLSVNRPGIAPEYQGKIFERDQTENTDIGLSIVKKILDNQGERICIESRSGEGASFYFTWHKNSPS